MASQDKCPVDHSQRGAWMEKMGSSSGSKPKEEMHSPTDQPKCPVDHSARSSWLANVNVTAKQESTAIELDKGCSSETLDNNPTFTSDTNLPTEREVSSIPRTDTRSNWIYPSQKQFYDAMRRKNWSPQAEDMQTVVPIHNQVNELAWKNILNWERSHVQESEQKCGGISLKNFRGDSKKLTPRAWFRSFVLGYEKPFDRHDWTVDRCGIDVPYVIDFYGGDQNSGVVVDARPKLQSWEGFKLRVGRAFGLL